MDETLLTTYSSIIGFMILIIGYFISRLITDLKKVVEDTGKNKGRIDLVAKQQENDPRRSRPNRLRRLGAFLENRFTDFGNHG